MKLKNIKYFVWLILGLGVYYTLMELLLFVESNAPEHSIKNLGDAIWYTFVTITTLGYGDVLPITTAGKFVGSIFIIFGVFFLGLIVSKFSDIFNDYRERKRMGLMGTNFENHIVIIGWDKFAELMVEELIASGRDVAIVTDNRDEVDFIYEKFGDKHVFVLFSSYTNFAQLDLVKVKKSQMIFVNFDSDTEKLVYILNMKRNHGDLKFMVTLNETELKETFVTAGVTFVLSKNEMASKLIASFIFEPNVAIYTSDLLDSAKSDDDYDIQEYIIKSDNKYCNKTYGEVFFDMKKTYGAVPIGLSKIENGTNTLMKLPSDDVKIGNGDSLIMLCNGAMAKLIERDFKVKQGKV